MWGKLLTTDTNRTVSASSAGLHLYECKIKGERMVVKHVRMILSGMRLEMLQFKGNLKSLWPGHCLATSPGKGNQ